MYHILQRASRAHGRMWPRRVTRTSCHSSILLRVTSHECPHHVPPHSYYNIYSVYVVHHATRYPRCTRPLETRTVQCRYPNCAVTSISSCAPCSAPHECATSGYPPSMSHSTPPFCAARGLIKALHAANLTPCCYLDVYCVLCETYYVLLFSIILYALSYQDALPNSARKSPIL